MSDNKSINDRRVSATPRGVPTATAIFADRAENAELWCVEGEELSAVKGDKIGIGHPSVAWMIRLFPSLGGR